MEAPTIMPRNCALWWQVWQAVLATTVWPATLSVGFEIFALPILNPPALTLPVVWQPELPQSAVPIGKWLLPGHPTIVIVLEGGGPANGPVPAAWQALQ